MSIGLGIWLVVLWVALWGTVSVANILSGIIVASVLLLLYRTTPPSTRGFRIRPLPAVRFLAYFLVKLLQSNGTVAWEVVTPRNRINTGVVAVPLEGCSDAVATIVAHALSLTPGAVSIELTDEPRVLYLHILHLHDIERVRADARRMALLALRAFGSSEAVAAFDAGASR